MPTYTSTDGICSTCIESLEAANLDSEIESTPNTDSLDGAPAPVATTQLSAGHATPASEFQAELTSSPEPCYYSRAPPSLLA